MKRKTLKKRWIIVETHARCKQHPALSTFQLCEQTEVGAAELRGQLWHQSNQRLWYPLYSRHGRVCFHQGLPMNSLRFSEFNCCDLWFTSLIFSDLELGSFCQIIYHFHWSLALSCWIRFHKFRSSIIRKSKWSNHPRTSTYFYFILTIYIYICIMAATAPAVHNCEMGCSI